jgi:hypothetical protein
VPHVECKLRDRSLLWGDVEMARPTQQLYRWLREASILRLPSYRYKRTEMLEQKCCESEKKHTRRVP